MSLFSNRLPGVPQAFSCLTRLEEVSLRAVGCMPGQLTAMKCGPEHWEVTQ